ncbi:LysR family transcriptional regulator [Patulibacter defluvii]|uniref:LysR family transcriptional regulator n=1 Tax=Patulibacter defluvii TaxID=3095358 RepID=UPI002A75E914|nr:LysR family transcriptional regulator [Patulibacter sp. DM4]
MELRQLQYFVAVARHRHVTRAAEALHVTQPALSQQIRRLEAELGVTLLHRTPKGVEPTAAGDELLARAERILADVAGTQAAMDAHAGALRGVVRVAAPAGEAAGLPAALAAFGGDHPGIGLALRHAGAGEAAELLRHGTVDLAVVATTPEAAAGPGLEATTLVDEPLRVLVAAGDPLAAAGELALWELRERPFVLAPAGSALREQAMAACAAAGFGPIPRFAVGDPGTVRHLVAAGLGVALAPRSWAGEGTAAVRPATAAGVHRLALLAAAGDRPPAVELLHEALTAALAA